MAQPITISELRAAQEDAGIWDKIDSRWEETKGLPEKTWTLGELAARWECPMSTAGRRVSILIRSREFGEGKQYRMDPRNHRIMQTVYWPVVK